MIGKNSLIGSQVGWIKCVCKQRSPNSPMSPVSGQWVFCLNIHTHNQDGRYASWEASSCWLVRFLIVKPPKVIQCQPTWNLTVSHRPRDEMNTETWSASDRQTNMLRRHMISISFCPLEAVAWMVPTVSCAWFYLHCVHVPVDLRPTRTKLPLLVPSQHILALLPIGRGEGGRCQPFSPQGRGLPVTGMQPGP